MRYRRDCSAEASVVTGDAAGFPGERDGRRAFGPVDLELIRITLAAAIMFRHGGDDQIDFMVACAGRYGDFTAQIIFERNIPI